MFLLKAVHNENMNIFRFSVWTATLGSTGLVNFKNPFDNNKLISIYDCTCKCMSTQWNGAVQEMTQWETDPHLHLVVP